ncbi:hypothetical protein ES708_19433 [subsurface metagenome]
MNIWKFLEDKKEEEKEKLGSQFGGGWGIADLVKETQKEEIDIGIPKGEVKAEGALKLEDKPKSELDILDEINESIEKDYKQYQSMTKKLETYQEGYTDAPDNIKPSSGVISSPAFGILVIFCGISSTNSEATLVAKAGQSILNC